MVLKHTFPLTHLVQFEHGTVLEFEKTEGQQTVTSLTTDVEWSSVMLQHKKKMQTKSVIVLLTSL